MEFKLTNLSKVSEPSSLPFLLETIRLQVLSNSHFKILNYFIVSFVLFFFNLVTVTTWYDMLMYLLLFLMVIFNKGKNNNNRKNIQHLCVRNYIKHLTYHLITSPKQLNGEMVLSSFYR